MKTERRKNVPNGTAQVQSGYGGNAGAPERFIDGRP